MHLEDLIMRVESSANWRAEKAVQYPDDKRNLRCSEALRELGRRLNELPADNEHACAYEAVVERLVELEAYDDRTSRHESEHIGRYGFNYPADGDPEAFLIDLVEQYQEWVSEAEEEAAKEERERAYEAACEAADEEAKEAAEEEAKEAAEEAAKEAAEAAYKEAYEEAYKEAYEEAYRDALIRALEE